MNDSGRKYRKSVNECNSSDYQNLFILPFVDLVFFKLDDFFKNLISKAKLIKYRDLYYETTGQDPNQRPALSNSSSQPLEQRPSSSSISSKTRESIGKTRFS